MTAAAVAMTIAALDERSGETPLLRRVHVAEALAYCRLRPWARR